MKVRVEMRGLPLRSTSRMVARTRTRLRRLRILTLRLPTGTRTCFRLLPGIENFFEPSCRILRRFLLRLAVRTRVSVLTLTVPEHARCPAQVRVIGMNLPLTSLTERPEISTSEPTTSFGGVLRDVVGGALTVKAKLAGVWSRLPARS